jgi:hypothetical protein
MDLKHKHNGIADAKESIKQGRTVLVFTLTTIIFVSTLPPLAKASKLGRKEKTELL